MTTLKNTTIAIIGAGNMGKALIDGCIKSDISPAQLIVIDPDAQKKETLLAMGVRATLKPDEGLREAQLIVFCVKPAQMQDTIKELVPFLDNQIIISIAAGLPIALLASWFGSPFSIVRAMPNTPATVGAGMTVFCDDGSLTHQMQQKISALFSAVGKVLWLPKESEMDVITAVSGSGPAYFFYLMEAMIEGGKRLGLSEQTATALVKQTALGAAMLASSVAMDCKELKERVTSKGGTTEAALRVFEQKDSKTTIIEAIEAAYYRSKEIGKQ